MVIPTGTKQKQQTVVNNFVKTNIYLKNQLIFKI